MNKRQLVVAWIMGIIFCITLWIYHWTSFTEYYTRISGGRSSLDYSTVTFIFFIFTISILGGLLIYTLRTRRKWWV